MRTARICLILFAAIAAPSLWAARVAFPSFDPLGWRPDGDAMESRSFGLVRLSGRVGERRLASGIAFADAGQVGGLGAMLEWDRAGRPAWADVARLAAVGEPVRDETTGIVSVPLRGEGGADGVRFAVEARVSLGPGRSDALVELVSAQNLGDAPLKVRGLFFRLWSDESRPRPGRNVERPRGRPLAPARRFAVGPLHARFRGAFGHAVLGLAGRRPASRRGLPPPRSRPPPPRRDAGARIPDRRAALARPRPRKTDGSPVKARIIQYRFGPTAAELGENFAWILSELDACDESLDAIVLPEGCHAPAPAGADAAHEAQCGRNNEALLAKAAETARRCRAAVFANARFDSPSGPRNSTFAFAPDGSLAGRYDKQNLTPGEHQRLDDSYTREPCAPTVIEIGGVRYAFLTCYDFYFVEQWAALARVKPDVIVGCSRQRTDTHEALGFQNRACAYATGAYLLRASVSMGADSPTGGCSCAIAPDGAVLGGVTNEVGHFDVEFDPHRKFLKKAGYVGNLVSTHPEYVERGRRPCKYRPAGSAIAPFLAELPAKRLCAHRGLHGAAVPENTLPALAAATAMGASEIEFDLWWTRDNVPVVIHDIDLMRLAGAEGRVIDMTLDELRRIDMGAKYDGAFHGLPVATFEEAMDKLACHATINLHLKDDGGPWDEGRLRRVIRCIDDHDARRHLYFMTSRPQLHAQLARLAPDIPRCMGNGGQKNCDRPDIVDRAIECKCQMVQLFKPYFTQDTIDRARAAGLRINVFWSDDPEEARRFLDMGIDTILTNRWLALSTALGIH